MGSNPIFSVHKRFFLFLDSSVVEQSAVNRWVVGSSPTRGASYRGIVQSVERWSPKPNVKGSSPFAPVKKSLAKLFVRGAFSFYPKTIPKPCTMLHKNFHVQPKFAHECVLNGLLVWFQSLKNGSF